MRNTLIILSLIGVPAGCTPPEDSQPRLQSYGMLFNPVCVLFCTSATETINAEGSGDASGGDLILTPTTTTPQANQNQATLDVN